jgi:hypothetical protein
VGDTRTSAHLPRIAWSSLSEQAKGRLIKLLESADQ